MNMFRFHVIVAALFATAAAIDTTKYKGFFIGMSVVFGLHAVAVLINNATKEIKKYLGPQ